MIIYNLTEKMLHDLLMDTIQENINNEHKERERLLDYYEGVNLEHDIKKYFDISYDLLSVWEDFPQLYIFIKGKKI